MATTQITRKTIVGFGYTSACEQVWNKSQTESHLRVCETTAPVHTGTLKSISEKIENDRTLQSYRGGTSYSTAWFVKVDGQWRKVTDQWFNEKTDELYRGFPFPKNSVSVEIE